jgi:hypothetical protein
MTSWEGFEKKRSAYFKELSQHSSSYWGKQRKFLGRTAGIQNGNRNLDPSNKEQDCWQLLGRPVGDQSSSLLTTSNLVCRPFFYSCA